MRGVIRVSKRARNRPLYQTNLSGYYMLIVLMVFTFILLKPPDNLNFVLINNQILENKDRCISFRIRRECWISHFNQINSTLVKLINEEWPNFTVAYYFCSNISAKESVPFPYDRIFRSVSKFYHFEDVFVTADYIVYTRNVSLTANARPARPPYTVTCCQSVQLGIFLRISWNTYGHFVHDVFGALFMYPEEVLKMNPIIITNYQSITTFKEHLENVGMGHFEIVAIGNNAVHCDQLYYLRPEEMAHEYNTFCLPRMSKMFRKYLKLENIKPTKYKFVNRKETERRHFTNVPELKNVLKIEFPDIELEDFYVLKRLNETALLFADCKVLIGSGGSLLCNSVFMQRGTGIVALFADRVDLPDNVMFGVLGIYSIGILHQNMSHYEGSGPMDIPETAKAFKIIKQAVEDQKYPHMKGYYPTINLTKFFKQEMREAYDRTVWAYQEPMIE